MSTLGERCATSIVSRTMRTSAPSRSSSPVDTETMLRMPNSLAESRQLPTFWFKAMDDASKDSTVWLSGPSRTNTCSDLLRRTLRLMVDMDRLGASSGLSNRDIWQVLLSLCEKMPSLQVPLASNSPRKYLHEAEWFE